MYYIIFISSTKYPSLHRIPAVLPPSIQILTLAENGISDLNEVRSLFCCAAIKFFIEVYSIVLSLFKFSSEIYCIVLSLFVKFSSEVYSIVMPFFVKSILLYCHCFLSFLVKSILLYCHFFQKTYSFILPLFVKFSSLSSLKSLQQLSVMGNAATSPGGVVNER